MLNEIFKADSYLSVNVGLEHKAGEPFAVGALHGVLITGSGTATLTGTAADGYDNGVGNQPGWASAALVGGYRIPVAAGATYAVGDPVYITPGAFSIHKTQAGGDILFGVVTHEPKTSATGAGTVIVRIAN
jgi:hypothetical protein